MTKHEFSKRNNSSNESNTTLFIYDEEQLLPQELNHTLDQTLRNKANRTFAKAREKYENFKTLFFGMLTADVYFNFLWLKAGYQFFGAFLVFAWEGLKFHEAVVAYKNAPVKDNKEKSLLTFRFAQMVLAVAATIGIFFLVSASPIAGPIIFASLAALDMVRNFGLMLFNGWQFLKLKQIGKNNLSKEDQKLIEEYKRKFIIYGIGALLTFVVVAALVLAFVFPPAGLAAFIVASFTLGAITMSVKGWIVAAEFTFTTTALLSYALFPSIKEFFSRGFNAIAEKCNVIKSKPSAELKDHQPDCSQSKVNNPYHRNDLLRGQKTSSTSDTLITTDEQINQRKFTGLIVSTKKNILDAVTYIEGLAQKMIDELDSQNEENNQKSIRNVPTYDAVYEEKKAALELVKRYFSPGQQPQQDDPSSIDELIIKISKSKLQDSQSFYKANSGMKNICNELIVFGEKFKKDRAEMLSKIEKTKNKKMPASDQNTINSSSGSSPFLGLMG